MGRDRENVQCSIARTRSLWHKDASRNMGGKYNFELRSEDRRRDLPHKIIIGQHDTETPVHVALKLLGYLLFYRERLLIEPSLHNDDIPFVPDLFEMDYSLKPVLWVECGECTTQKLNKLAVKVPEAKIWVLKRSVAESEQLIQWMTKADLRRQRYHIIGFDEEMFDEMLGLLHTRNELFWVSGEFDPPTLQFDFNGLWFDAPFTVHHF